MTSSKPYCPGTLVGAFLAFSFCFAAGLWVLFDLPNAIETGIALYFIGKAIFVGLLLTHKAYSPCPCPCCCSKDGSSCKT